MPNYSDILEAQNRLKGHARRTPLLNSPFLDEVAGKRVFVKAECLQRTGSFKFRGAWSAISALAPEIRAKGVIAFSSGNHAQGVAHAAALHDIPAVIIMPMDAPEIKIRNTRAYGAEVVLYDRANGASREEAAAEIQKTRDLTLLAPFDNEMVIAGQGTVGLEIAEQAQEMHINQGDVAICCGGGGLTAGIAIALSKAAPNLTPRPAEPEGFDDVTRSLVSGAIQTNNQISGSLCDAILTPAPGAMTWPYLKKHCGAGHVVSDAECLHAMALAFEHLKIVVEPGGAAGLAAAIFRASDHDDVIAVATGGNVDADIFQTALKTFGSK